MITGLLHLLYSTFVRVPVVSYHANLYWNGYANIDNYSYPLGSLPCTWLTNVGSHTIQFLVFYTTPCFLSVVFSIVNSIALGAPGDVKATTKCQISPLLTVLILRNPWVHICSTNGRNVLSNVESPIDDILCTRTTLRIPDVYPYYCFIWLRRHFDNV